MRHKRSVRPSPRATAEIGPGEIHGSSPSRLAGADPYADVAASASPLTAGPVFGREHEALNI